MSIETKRINKIYRSHRRQWGRKRWLEEQQCSPVVIVKDKDMTTETEEELKQMPYLKYLETKHWFLLSNKCKKRARFKCKKCKRKWTKTSLHAHHKTYKNKGNFKKEFWDLVCLCKDCHKTVHRFD